MALFLTTLLFLTILTMKLGDSLFGPSCITTCTEDCKNFLTTSTNELWKAVYMRRVDASCALARLQHFSEWNDVMASILKVWRQIENPSIDAYLLEEHCCEISSRFNLKWRSLELYEECRPNNKNNSNKTSSDIQSGPKKVIPQFLFRDNFRKYTPILTIFSLVEQEIHGA